MKRKQIIDFCNNEIFPQVDYRLIDLSGMRETINLVSRWRIGKPSNVDMQPKVVNGYLFMNGDPLGRIASAPSRFCCDEKSLFYEGKILASCGL